MDLGKLREAAGLKFDGILGMDFLRNHVVRIDFDNDEVNFLRSVGPNPGVRVPVIFQGNWPCVAVFANPAITSRRSDS
jgi:hypothetical protein